MTMRPHVPEGLTGAIDLHVHAGPDVRPRKRTAVELARDAVAAGMAGFVLKSHHASTIGEAAALRELFPALEVWGGIALNDAVGGLNPSAVEAALRRGASMVWLPTYCAAAERAWRGKPGGLTVLDGERLRPEMVEILKLVAEHDATLGLGHASPAEIRAVVKQGRASRVARFVVNHPEIEFMALPLGFQRELLGPDLIFERCYVRDNCVVDWDGLTSIIREVGVESSALATDLGQPQNPDPVSGFAEMMMRLRERGFTATELETMAVRNPRRALGGR